MKPRILLIEDDLDVCTALQGRLLMEGYDIRMAANGRQGLQLYDDSPADLVITDVLMPETDGLEVIRTLRREQVPPLIIAMSGGGSQDLDFLVEASEFGANKTITKPFLLNDMVSLVNDLFNSIPHSDT